MRRRAFIRLLPAVFAISLLSAGPSHAQSPYWSPYRSWWGDQTFRQRYREDTKKPEVKKKDWSEHTSKSVAKESAKGPLLLIISIADQRISLYDNGAVIARSAVSTGVKDHPTPLGVFSVISKARWHRSNIYSAAPMPYMQRITWSGIALHAGVLPGHPASHGCIRLAKDFAIRLWHLTKRGTRVIIAPNEVDPVQIASPRLFSKPKTASSSQESSTDAPASKDTLSIPSAPAGLVSNIQSQDGINLLHAGETPQKRAVPISVFVSRKLSRLFV